MRFLTGVALLLVVPGCTEVSHSDPSFTLIKYQDRSGVTGGGVRWESVWLRPNEMAAPPPAECVAYRDGARMPEDHCWVDEVNQGGQAPWVLYASWTGSTYQGPRDFIRSVAAFDEAGRQLARWSDPEP